MKIAETFYSIQGEGTLLGVPSVFLRTTGCNLRCVWCDTPYTSWKPEGQEVPIADLIGYVEQHSTGHVVVTGGEPMIQPEIVGLTRALRDAGQHITIETAGTVYQEVECDLMSISPKLGNSAPAGDPFFAQHERLRYQPEVLMQLTLNYDHQLKFVIREAGDLGEVDAIVRSLGVDPYRVLLMPEGRSPEQLRERSLWLVESCKQTGYRLAPRLHVDLWGHRRGV